MPNVRPQKSGVQTQPLSGLLPPVAQNKMPLGFIPQCQSQTQSQPSSSLASSQYATMSVPLQVWFQTLTPLQHPLGQPVAGSIQSLHPRHSTHLVAPIQTSIPTHSLLEDNVFKNTFERTVSPSLSSSMPKLAKTGHTSTNLPESMIDYPTPTRSS